MKHGKGKLALVALSVVALGACASTPMGPMVEVMPGPNKPFQVFQDDEVVCQHYATQQVGSRADSVNEKAVGGAILGTVLGAGLGAAIGGGRGAGVGAALGSIVGLGSGAGSSEAGERGIQRQYDIAYAQCMYSRGNQVPGYQSEHPVAPPPPPPSPPSHAQGRNASPPPPPPGSPPPPPPGYSPGQ